MSPALLINETSAPASPETAENTASPSPTSEPLTLDGPSPATTSRLNRRSPLLRRSVRTPALWLEEAEGSWLTVTDGVKKWKIFDASGGASVSNIGYKDSRVYAATRKQEDTGIQYAASMTFNTHAPYDFADLLLESTGDEMREVVFFGSGNAFRFLLLFVNDMLTTTRLRSPRSFPKAFQNHSATGSLHAIGPTMEQLLVLLSSADTRAAKTCIGRFCRTTRTSFPHVMSIAA
jgi:hypothetical protein